MQKTQFHQKCHLRWSCTDPTTYHLSHDDVQQTTRSFVSSATDPIFSILRLVIHLYFHQWWFGQMQLGVAYSSSSLLLPDGCGRSMFKRTRSWDLMVLLAILVCSSHTEQVSRLTTPTTKGRPGRFYADKQRAGLLCLWIYRTLKGRNLPQWCPNL